MRAPILRADFSKWSFLSRRQFSILISLGNVAHPYANEPRLPGLRLCSVFHLDELEQAAGLSGRGSTHLMKHHLYIGIDRSDQFIDTHILDGQGRFVSQSCILSAPEALMPWVQSIQLQLPKGAIAALCIEQPCANLNGFLRQFPFLQLYLINPIILKNYRETFNLSKAKDDKKDALHLAKLIYEKHDLITPWTAPDDSSAKLDILSKKRRQLVEARSGVSNRLTQLLKDYYPQALSLTGRSFHTRVACDFLQKWPTLQSAKRARPHTVRKFYISHSSSRPKLNETRLEIIAQAVPLTNDPATLETYAELTQAYAQQLTTLNTGIKRFEDLISETLSEHPDTHIFRSLPSAGDIFCARLISFFGADRTRYPSALDVQNASGIAPVTKQSGTIHHVQRRYACSKFWRQTFVEWAGLSVIRSRWAKAFYQQQKAKGNRHHVILRSLAYKWIRIIHRCWQDQKPYCEEKYLGALKTAGSPLCHRIEQQNHPDSREGK